MSHKATLLLYALAFGPLVPAQNAAAQDEKIKIEDQPLSVMAQFSTAPVADCNSGNGVIVQFHYLGTKPLRAYLVSLAPAYSAPVKTLTKQIIQEVRDSREPIVNGAEWTRTICSVVNANAGTAARVIPIVDALRFADGSIWGPGSLPESHQLFGTMDGMDFSVKTSDLLRYVSPILPRGGPVPVEDIQFQTIGPLRIETGTWHEENGTALAALQATNVGTAPIRAFVFATIFLDPNSGAKIRSVTTKELETQGNPSHYLLPGASWVAGPRKFSYLADGTRASYKITLDLVVFADGSTFGPKKGRESDEVLGMLRGIDSVNLANHGAPATQNQ
jgi:hypothetical protein